MLGTAFEFLKDALNAQRASNGPIVVFPDDGGPEGSVLRLNAVTLLLLNVEDEPAGQSAGFSLRPAQGENLLSLNVLFVARFADYRSALDELWKTIAFFKAQPVFNGASLPQGVEQIALAQVPLPIAGQHELWGALRVGLLPAALYRVRLRLGPVASPRNG